MNSFILFLLSAFSSVSETSIIQILVLLHYNLFLSCFPLLWYFVLVPEIFLQLSIYFNAFSPVLLYQFFNFQEFFLEFLFHLFLNVVLLFPLTVILPAYPFRIFSVFLFPYIVCFHPGVSIFFPLCVGYIRE